jgi:hypothetical protein
VIVSFPIDQVNIKLDENNGDLSVANNWMIFVYIWEYNEPDYLSGYFI